MLQHVEPKYPRVELVLNAIADWINRYRKTRADRSALSTCRPEEVKMMARDLGMSRDDLIRIGPENPQSSKLLDRLLHALGVESVAHQDAAVMNDLRRLCVSCGEKRRCAHELASTGAAQNFREYCPNALTLDALITEKGIQRRPHRRQ